MNYERAKEAIGDTHTLFEEKLQIMMREKEDESEMRSSLERELDESRREFSNKE